MQRILVLVSGLLAVGMLSGCGKEGNAKLSFAIKSAARNSLFALDPMMPARNLTNRATQIDGVTSFKIRFIAAYLVQDVDATTQNNVGDVAMFYLNPQCKGDINTCGMAGSGKTNEVTDYFDFTTAETANAAINSSATAVKTGTYKYVRLEFCQGSVTDDQVEYQLTGMAASKKTRTGTCGITSREANPPITVAAGGTVTVTLSYNVKEMFSLAAPTDPTEQARCASDATPNPTAQSGSYTHWCLSSINGSVDDPTTGIVPSFSTN